MSGSVSVPAPVTVPGGVARVALQRRTLRVLALGQVVGAAALASAVTVGGFVVQDILGAGSPWIGVSTAALTAGAGAASQLLSWLMRRRGRRIGMAVGYGCAVAGGVIACVGVQTGTLALFLTGLLAFGAGSSTNLLARYAATDLAEPGERGRAMGRVLFASTAGAVLGPTLIGPAEHAGQTWLGLDRYAGPWLFSSVLFLCSMVNIAVRLTPDPLLVAVAARAPGPPQAPIRLADPVRVLVAAPAARLALLAMAVSQAVMVGVMAMAPLDLKSHGHEHVSSYVVSLHIAGMFAFTPLVARYTDRHGPVASLRVGAVVLVGANLMAVFSSDDLPVMFAAMTALGLGWAFALVGGSTLLIDSVPAQHGVAVQGAADLAMSVCGGVASVVYGLVMSGTGFALLTLGSAITTLVIFLAGFWTSGVRRAPARP